MRIENKNLRKYEGLEGFYYFVDDDRYALSRRGAVYSTVHKKYVPFSVNKGYLRFGNYPLHRAMAKTFLDSSHIPKDEKPIVNHLDGNPSNNHIDNLEWTTYQGNSIHAYSTGLRTDNVPVRIKHIKTGIEKKFYSIQECARYLHVSVGSVHNHLRGLHETPIIAGMFYITTEDGKWPELTDKEIRQYTLKVRKELYLRDTKTKKSFIVKSAARAAEILQISYSMLLKALGKTEDEGGRVTVIGDYEVSFLIDMERTSRKTVTAPVERKERDWVARKPVAITVTDLQTGVISRIGSVEEFAAGIGEKKNTVQKHISLNNGIWRNKFLIQYQNEHRSF